MTWKFESEEVDPKELEEEAQFAELFLRAGGRVSVEEWLRLSVLDAQALVLAGDRLRIQAHVDAQLAGQPTGVGELYAQLDGGQLVGQLNLRAVVAQGVERRKDAEAANYR